MEPANNHKSQARIEWIAMFLLIGNTANPFFYQSIEMLFLSFLVLLTLLFFKKGDDTRINRHFWIYVLILTVLQAAQTLVYHVFPLKTFMGEYLRIAFAITALKILGQGFFPMFVRFV